MISDLYLVSSGAAIIVVLLSSLGSLQVFSSSLMGFFEGGSEVPCVLRGCFRLMRFTTIHNVQGQPYLMSKQQVVGCVLGRGMNTGPVCHHNHG